MARAIKSFSLDTETDRDLISFLDSLPRGSLSKLIRDLLRGHLEKKPDLDLILQAIARLESKIGSGTVIEPQGDAPGTEQAASNLDSLGV